MSEREVEAEVEGEESVSDQQQEAEMEGVESAELAEAGGPGDCDTDMMAQCNETHCRRNDLIHPEEDNARGRKDKCDLVGNRTYFSYHNDNNVGKAYNEVGTLASNASPFVEKTSHGYKQEEISCDRDTYYIDQQKKESNSDNDNYYADQEQEKCSVFSEHTYQRRESTQQKRESGVEGYCNNYTKNEPSNQANEFSTLPYESNVSTTNLPYSKSPSFIQLTNLPVEVQEPYQQTDYEYFNNRTNSNQRSNALSSDTQAMCVVREYVYPPSDDNFQDERSCKIKRVPSYNKYYYYEQQNVKGHQNEVKVSSIQQDFEEQSYIYESEDGRLYNRGEQSNSDHGSYEDKIYVHLKDKKGNENNTYFVNQMCYKEPFEDKDDLQKKYISVTNENEHIYEQKSNFYRNETSAVDLRILRPLFKTEVTDKPQQAYNSIEEIDSQVTNDFSNSDKLGENGHQHRLCNNEDVNLINSSYITPDQMYYDEDKYSATEHPTDGESFKYSICETIDIENNNLWDAGTNTDHIKVEDKESQTWATEVRDIGVQTDIDSKVFPLALFKNIQDEIMKYTCPICQRVYISKSSFDRHLKTHDKGKNNKIITNVRFTTEAKLQICKRASKNKHLKTHNPIIIQVPKAISHCDTCKRIFSNQRDKDSHDCTLNPFPLTKCPECHIKFYTTGALNEHIGIVHKKENTYNCIFCNKSFNAGYSFHLHLDEHLSSQ